VKAKLMNEAELSTIAFNLLPGLVRESQIHKTIKPKILRKQFTELAVKLKPNVLSKAIIEIAKEWKPTIDARRAKNSKKARKPQSAITLKKRIENLIQTQLLWPH
jgi:hypothetical protein